MAATTHPGQSLFGFRLACWVLALIAFCQLLTAGMGLAARFERSKEVRIVEAPARIITVEAPARESQALAGAPAQPAASALPPPLPPESTTPLPPPRPLNAPAIRDPQVERLVMEARTARIAGDMATAIVKLEAAREQAPEEPNVYYELGLVYEDMAAFDPRLVTQASDAYQVVFRLGTSGAGSLYELAAAKLRDGIAMPIAMRGKLALGRPRIFKDDEYEEGERVVLTIPVQSAPGVNIDPGAIDVIVEFFESTSKGGIEPTFLDPQAIEKKWVSEPVDMATGEELLRVNYILPEQSESQVHLFGKRKYYGQVVKLFYKGELLDLQAYPQHLASNSGMAQFTPSSSNQGPEFISEEQIFDLSNPLLLRKPGADPGPNGVPPLEPIPDGLPGAGTLPTLPPR